jgi:hypothetical protein
MELKKYVDTVLVLGGLLSGLIWMNSQFNELGRHFSSIETRLTKIETVLIQKGLMPPVVEIKQ